MNLRQVHLDFHTSEKISGIGKDFSKENFQEALKIGHVNSITVFSKCHHGWAYHPSEANQMHPGLDFDLLGAQIEAAHEIGVKTPVYLSAGLDEKYAIHHPEHLVRTRNDSNLVPEGFEIAAYHKLCLNTPYLDTLLDQITEVLENYDADGIFLDIVCVQPCYCATCRNQLIAEGKDPYDYDNVMELAERVYAEYARRVRETIDKVRPGLPVFHNGGHIRRGRRDLAHANTHLELESLPTGGWGYDNFPVSASYARVLGMDFLGMTGKFHTSWGEFGGFKHPNALRYETALSVANGAACSVGDQLHPYGKMELASYELIGAGYKEIEEKEEYLIGARNLTEIAVFGTEALDNYNHGNSGAGGVISTSDSDAGCGRMLLEGKYLFDYVDADTDLSKYKVVILPDSITTEGELAEKLRRFVAQGGKLLASGKSGTDLSGGFAFDFGAEFVGENEYNPTYVRPGFEISGLRNSAYLMYAKSYVIKNVTGDALGSCENPFFNRTYEHFCSHKHAPNNPDDSFVAVSQGKDGAYIGWDIFEDYATTGCFIAREIVTHVLDRLLGDKLITAELPSSGVVTLTQQNDRRIVHLLNANPVERGNGINVIEDIMPVLNTAVSVKVDKPTRRVYLAPQGEDIEFAEKNGRVDFVVDSFECHQMIVIE